MGCASSYTGRSTTRAVIVLLMALASCNPSALAQFTGGNADGYSQGEFEPSGSIFNGGYQDGFGQSYYNSSGTLYRGKYHDGFEVSTFNSPGSIHRGDTTDGYASALFLYYHKWTGNVGTGWLVAGNWEGNVVPTEDIRVRIPGDAAHMPGVNAGTFKIGTDSGADYTCKALWVGEGANLLCRINTFIENHSYVRVDGVFRWRNEDQDSFVNMPGAVIEIGDGGVLKTEY